MSNNNILNIAPIHTVSNDSLTERQKAKAREMAHKMDLTDLTRYAFGNIKLDGRSKEGRSLKKFLIKENLTYETREYKKARTLKLTNDQKKFINENHHHKGKLTLAREAFNDKTIQNLSLPARAVSEYVDHITGIDRSQLYYPPKSMPKIVGKVNRYCNLKLDEPNLKAMDTERCVVLINNLNTERFVRIMSEFDTNDRDLFESEFITHTFDKPDLTPEEVNLYINLCSEYVSEVAIQRQVRLLDERLTELTEDEKFSKSLADTIKTKTDEQNHCKTRQEKLIQILIGKRSDRIKNQHNRNKDILSLVHAWEKEDERLKALKIVERQNALIEKSMNELETSSSYFARILGPAKEEILN